MYRSEMTVRLSLGMSTPRIRGILRFSVRRTLDEAGRGRGGPTAVAGHQPCRCLWRGLAQMTYTLPRRRTILQFSQIRLTLDRTFIALKLAFRHRRGRIGPIYKSEGRSRKV